MYRFRKRCHLLAVLLLLITEASGRNFVADPGIADTVFVDSLHAVMPDTVVMPVSFFNDRPVAAIEVTLRHTSPYLVIDTFLFDGGRLEYIDLRDAIADDNTVTIFGFPTYETPVPPGSGLLGNLILTYPEDTEPHSALFDTVTIAVDLIEHGTYFTDTSLSAYVPEFQQGFLYLQKTCCYGMTGNVDGSLDGVIDIGDLTILIRYLFMSPTPTIDCLADANIDGSTDGVVDIGDLTQLIAWLYISAEASPLAPCP